MTDQPTSKPTFVVGGKAKKDTGGSTKTGKAAGKANKGGAKADKATAGKAEKMDATIAVQNLDTVNSTNGEQDVAQSGSPSTVEDEGVES